LFDWKKRLDPRCKQVVEVVKAVIGRTPSSLGMKLVLQSEFCNHFHCNCPHSWDTEQRRQVVGCTKGGELAEGLKSKGHILDSGEVARKPVAQVLEEAHIAE
jgi:hypothetical protein